jgi:AcrR family transcriptional regulator
MATYRYYPGKETLIEDVRLHVSNEFASVLQEAAARAGDPVARFRYMCLAYIDFAVSNEQDYRLMFGTVAQPTSVTGNAARRAPAWEALLQVLEELPHPECPASIADQAHLVWSNLHGLAMLHLSKRLNFGRSIRDLADPLFTFLLRALCVPAAADAHRRPDPAA